MKYIPGLDSLRAFAVILVIISHWFPKIAISQLFPLGSIGVDVFFVLSGFLITYILLGYKNNSNVSIKQKFKVFYVRRVLRIFPIYYLSLFLLYIFHEYTDTNIKSDFIYHFTYTSNFYFIKLQNWNGMVSHLWSLSVEEQFYLIWPFLILLIRKKYLIHLIVSFIIIGFISRTMFYHNSFNRLLTTSCFDSFGIGALLSWVVLYKDKYIQTFYSYVKYIGLTLISLSIIGYIVFSNFYWFRIPSHTVHSILAIWLITYIYIRRNSDDYIHNIIFNNSVIVYIGQISYGLYLYHNMINRLIIQIRMANYQYIETVSWLKSILYNQEALLFLNLILLFLVSWASFKFIEMPILKLKKRFEIRPSSQIPPLVSA